MGIFREYGLIDEFYAKNNLQKNLYYLVCQIWASLDPLKIKEKFGNALESISSTIYEIYNENPISDKSEINSKEEELQSDIRKKINYQKEHVEEIRYKDMIEVMTLCFRLYNLKFPDGKI